ncbi:MAG: hypothetical protein JO247_05780 [Chloroflexi bacterium]|nr:hypothetical protein [Chloroflexota bacterium]
MPDQTSDELSEGGIDAAAQIRQLTPELTKLGYPPALIKAVCDPYDYAMKLRTGDVIHFSAADPNGDWVWISFDGLEDGGVTPNERSFAFNRGMYVRVADIVWVADAPNAHSQSWVLEGQEVMPPRKGGFIDERRGRSA